MHKVDRRVEHSHHFSSMIQEHEAGKQGTWMFMATEVMMFGALFCGYFMYRFLYPDAYVVGGELLNWKLGAANTVVLLLSSFTMALAVRETQLGNNKKAFNMIIITTLCAAFFMVVKYFEYSGKIHAGLFPGRWVPIPEYMDKINAIVSEKGLENFKLENLRLFLVVYFVMTGLHGIHILIGIGLMFWLMKRLKNNEFSKDYYTAVEGVGLYWHIVDLIWIYLFPLMYLM
jgi:cytochrome c oxidase subunit 3